ncbi:Protein of unknown function [Paenimyroides aquimaris]|uniref:DUF2975 domain-containing protein n=1 Tax=Paenimyroides marinum TaxID=1159016 RepID=A0A1H6MUB9_9FLAO|nr:DUF2975 domain-containing protein [Paenimyroides aquimaris]SEI02353.1 Protein of unknown function [Paenimyroides aquimaris]
MRTLKIFGWLSHFLWATMLLLCIFFGVLVYSEFNNNQEYQNWLIEFMGREVATENNKSYFQIFISVCFIVYLLYFYAITLFNLCVRKFEKRIFFDEKIIKRFKKVGFIFITNFIIVFLLDRMFVIHSEKTIQASTNFSNSILTKLEAPLGSLIIGFFFLVLSQVFKEAKKQKEENELTI